jgi:hypothetical protein
MADIDVAIDNEKDICTFTVSNDVQVQEIIAKIDEVYPRISTKFIIWDFTEASPAGITLDNIQEIAFHAGKFIDIRQEGKTAIIGHKDIAYGLARMYEAVAENQELPYEYGAFRSVAAALQWFGLEQS